MFASAQLFLTFGQHNIRTHYKSNFEIASLNRLVRKTKTTRIKTKDLNYPNTINNNYLGYIIMSTDKKNGYREGHFFSMKMLIRSRSIRHVQNGAFC